MVFYPTEEIIKSWAKEYNEGYGFKQIGMKHGVSSSTIWKYLHKKIKSRLRGGGLHSRTVRNLTKFEATYLAGIFNGEGSLIIIKDKRRNRSMRTQFSITNTNKELMDWIESLGGPTVKWRKGTNKKIGNWDVCGTNDVYYLLNRLLPFLKVKRKKALDAIEIVRQKRNPKNKSKAYKRWHGERII